MARLRRVSSLTFFDTEDEKKTYCNNLGVDVVFSLPFVRVMARKFVLLPL